jgi:hypothetical protein
MPCYNISKIIVKEINRMKIRICSKKEAERLMKSGFPDNAAVISFYGSLRNRSAERMDYSDVCQNVFYVNIPDIDIECLGDNGYTYEGYFTEAPALARFIIEAEVSGLDIICQCDYGQSRSAACAAAIKQYFFGNGIDIFADYRYYPNQLVYNKLFEAMKLYR